MLTTTNAPTTCQICGCQTWAKYLVVTEIDNYWIMTCPKCFGLLNTCSSCDYNNKCNFKIDHSEPQMVTQQIRQGFMSGTIQIKNPNLIEKHCISCKCSWGNKGECSKDNNGVACNHYRIIPDLLQSGVPILNK